MSQPIVPSITDEQLDELEKLCLKVAQGPRRVERDEDSCAGAVFVCSGLEMYSGGEICRTYSEDDAALIVATGPEDILALIARLRATEKDAARWRLARKILEVRNIQEGTSSYIEYGLLGSEEYNLEIDQAIDAAMEQQP